MTPTEQAFDLARRRLCDAALEWQDSGHQRESALSLAVDDYQAAFDALEADRRDVERREREADHG